MLQREQALCRPSECSIQSRHTQSWPRMVMVLTKNTQFWPKMVMRRTRHTQSWPRKVMLQREQALCRPLECSIQSWHTQSWPRMVILPQKNNQSWPRKVMLLSKNNQFWPRLVMPGFDMNLSVFLVNELMHLLFYCPITTLVEPVTSAALPPPYTLPRISTPTTGIGSEDSSTDT